MSRTLHLFGTDYTATRGTDTALSSYHTETRPSDDNQDDNYIALLILIGGLSIGGYLLYRKRKINKYR